MPTVSDFSLSGQSVFCNGGGICHDHGEELYIGDKDFTVDWYEYRTTYGNNPILWNTISSNGYDGMCHHPSHTPNIDDITASWYIIDETNGRRRYDLHGGKYVYNEWVHRALVRKSGTMYSFFNGRLIHSIYNIGIIASSGKITIGTGLYNPSIYYYYGYIDSFRFSVGIGLWTTDFIPSLFE